MERSHASAGVFPRQILLRPRQILLPLQHLRQSLSQYIAGARAPSSLVVEMSTPAGPRKPKKGSAVPALALGHGGASTAAAPASLSSGGGSAAPAPSLGRGGASAAPAPPSLGRGAPWSFPTSAAPWTFPSSAAPWTFPNSASAWIDSSAWHDGDPSSSGSWDKDVRPAGGFMSYFANQAHNSHLVGSGMHNSTLSSPVCENNDASSPPSVELLNGNANGNIRTEKRIMWTMEEDVRVMSAWIEHSTDSSCGADNSGHQCWGDVVESYNKTTPPLRKRNLKQCKDRWHKINRWTDLFECAYVKARRVFTSGYSDQMWIDAAHKFYVDDNKEANLCPFSWRFGRCAEMCQSGKHTMKS